MLRLLYCSRAAGGAEQAADLAIHQILATSRRNNARDDVTGALLFSGGAFAQFLEGPDDAVARVFERVRHDPRHHDVAVVHQADAAERLFQNWSMSFAADGKDVQALAPAVFQRCRAAPGEPAAEDMLRLIRMGLADVQIW
jgi:hypothetical protein